MFWVLSIALVIVNLFTDVLEIIVNLLDEVFLIGVLLGFILGFIIDPIVSLFTILLLIILGGDIELRIIIRRTIIYILGILAEFFPIIDFLPIRTITLIITLILTYTSLKKKSEMLRELKEMKIEQEELERQRVEISEKSNIYQTLI